MKETQRIKELVTDYLNNTTNGKALLEVHSLKEKSIWQVYGEDPDCHTPGEVKPEVLLTTVQGTLEQALKVAVSFHSFYKMGCGGRINEVKINISYNNI